MKTKLTALQLFLLVMMFTVSFGLQVDGQTLKERLAVKTVSEAVLRGNAKSLPKPVYPVSARSAKIAGEVKIEVMIDQTGKVTAAKAVGGVEDLALRRAGEAAALQAEFLPSVLYGRAVKIRGIITYTFVAPRPGFKLMAATALLMAAKSFSNDAERLKQSFGGEDVLSDMIADLPEYAVEFDEVKAFHQLTAEKRIQSIDAAISAIRAKVADPLKWQIDVGIQLGELTGPMAVQMKDSGDPAESKHFNEATTKVNLLKIADLAAKPPRDFPRTMLKKLVALGSLAGKEKLGRSDNFKEYQERVGSFMGALLSGNN